MLAFVLLFFIMVITVGMCAYLYSSENTVKWIITFSFSFLLLILFYYVRTLEIKDGLSLAEQNYMRFFKESLGTMSYWCTVVLLFMSLISFPKVSFESIKKNIFAIIYYVFCSISLIKLWSL